jgi:hypothetical protein
VSERAAEMLEALLAATEAAWAACERDASSIEQVAELVRNRQRCLSQMAAPTDVSPRERELATRLRELDVRLLDWCEQRRRELAEQIAALPTTAAEQLGSPDFQAPARVDEPTVADARILSDFA